MPIIQTSSPFIGKFTHTEGTLTGTGTWDEVLPALTNPTAKRINLIIQNKDDTDTIQVHFGPAANATAGGLNLAPGAAISLDNYKGAVQAQPIAGTPVIHVAYSIV